MEFEVALNHFLFGVYPYICGAVFAIGSLIRFDREQYTWKSDSSQLLRARELRWGSNLFHFGVLFIFFGHFFGMLTPPAVESPADLYRSQLDIFLDPGQPHVQQQARQDGVPEAWLEAARASPAWRLAVKWKIAFPLHPEYRTLPMVWYVPPLSPIQSYANAGDIGSFGEIPDVRSLRIPVRYLANLLTAGDETPVVHALERMLAMRAFFRERQLEARDNLKLLEQAGLSVQEVEEMHRYLAIANYEDRFVIPTTHREYAENAYQMRGECGFSFGNGCSGADAKASLFGGRMSGRKKIPLKVVVERAPAPKTDA